MDSKEIKNKLKLLLAYNVGEVLDLIQANLVQKNPLVNEVILFISRYNDLNRDATFKRLNRGEITVEMNRIRLSVIEFIDASNNSELNLDQVTHTLLNENKFQEIIEKKETSFSFRGMVGGGKEIIIESLVFKWEQYLMHETADTSIPVEKLAPAIHLLQSQHGLPLWEVKETDKQKLYESLVQTVEALRTLPKVKTFQWATRIKGLSQQFPEKIEHLLGAVHETIEVLVE